MIKSKKIKDLQTSALQLKQYLNSIPDEKLEYCRIVLQLPKFSTNGFILTEMVPEEYKEEGKLVHIRLFSVL